jgi:glutamate carboxypeptidase
VINRVPHFASASIEMRAFSLEAYEKGIAEMLALNDLSTISTANGDYRCRVRTMILNQVLPWQRNESTDELFDVWQSTAHVLGFEIKAEARAGLSDGNYFWDSLPTLDGLGPAGGNAHCSERSADGSKDQEFVNISSFVPKAHLNAMAILELINSKTAVD